MNFFSCLFGTYDSFHFAILQFYRPHYNLYMQSISVNGQILPIDSSVFATSANRGTIVDSGTTLAYLVADVYDPFVSAVSGLAPSPLSLLGCTHCTVASRI